MTLALTLARGTSGPALAGFSLALSGAEEALDFLELDFLDFLEVALLAAASEAAFVLT